MQACRISIYLAYAMAVYCIASLFYLIRTKDIGTPFKDSLSPKQKEIKKKSAAKRRSIFIQGIIGGAVLLFFFQPFKQCV